MKIILILSFSILTMTNIYSQSSYSDYFLGKRTYCSKPSDSKSIELFDLGIKCIHNNLYLGSAAEIFQKLIKTDSTFCDAYFWAGYTFRLSNMNKEAVTFYYIADSLAQNKSIEFKQNLATTSMLIGAVDLSRKKFKEMIEFFPESPEGYYGIALTSTMIGDFLYGLENIEIAEKKYNYSNKDSKFLKAILLNLNGKFQESLTYFEDIKGKFSKDDNFNGHYALSLFEVGELNNDEKMIKLAKKHYNKVKNKADLTNEIRAKFE